MVEIARKQLEEKADLFFSYSIQKNGRRFEKIFIKIHKNKNIEGYGYIGIKHDEYEYCHMFLSIFFPNYESDAAFVYVESIAAHQNISRAYLRFKSLDDELTNGKKQKHDIKNLLKRVIIPELTSKEKLNATKKNNHGS